RGGVGSLPRALAGYAADQVKAVCVASESDRLWQISPPARQALVELLQPASTSADEYMRRRGMYGAEEDGGVPVVLEVSWALARSVPLSSERSGPACMAAAYGATLSRFGVTGLYFTFVFALGRFLRLSVSSLRLRIPTEDLPSTRRLVALCQDIYVARAEGELILEEQLYRALINVYRSPDLLFELSKRHKQA
ncbi:Protein PIEZO, partial [Tetrabaena socialis]